MCNIAQENFKINKLEYKTLIAKQLNKMAIDKQWNTPTTSSEIKLKHSRKFYDPIYCN